jgi:hypothetical protein
MYMYIPEKFQSSNSVDLSSHSAALSNSCAVVGVAADAGKCKNIMYHGRVIPFRISPVLLLPKSTESIFT